MAWRIGRFTSEGVLFSKVRVEVRDWEVVSWQRLEELGRADNEGRDTVGENWG